MFSLNQIRKRNLLSETSNTQDPGSTDREDFSQLQNAQFTQFESSQYSQDFESQRSTYSTGCNAEPRRSTSTYEKYMSKPSLFRTGSQGNISHGRLGSGGVKALSQERRVLGSIQQSSNHGSSAQALGEERAAMNNIVSIVQKCTDEVKQNLQSLHSAEEDSRGDIKTTIKTLLTSVEDYNTKILTAVQRREEHFTAVAALHGQIIKKDEKISQLQDDKLDNAADASNSIQESVSTFLAQQKIQIEDTLQHLLVSNQKNMSTDFNRKLDKIIEQQEKLLAATSNGLTEIRHSVEDLERRPWNNDIVPKQIQIQLDSLFDKHKSEIDKLRAEIAEQRKEKEHVFARKEPTEFTNSLQTVYDFHENNNTQSTTAGMKGPLFPKNNGFLSPRGPQDTVWSSKVLFGRSNPSPVATVLPQRQTSTVSAKQRNDQPLSRPPTSRQQASNISSEQNRNAIQPLREQQHVPSLSRQSREDEAMHLQDESAKQRTQRKRRSAAFLREQIPTSQIPQQTGRMLRSQSQHNDRGGEYIAKASQQVNSSEQSSQATDDSSPEQKRQQSSPLITRPPRRGKHRKQRKKPAQLRTYGKKQSPQIESSAEQPNPRGVRSNGVSSFGRQSKEANRITSENHEPSLYRSMQKHSESVFDFHDSPPLVSQHLQQRNRQLATMRERSVSKWQGAAQTDSYDSSGDSSPSLSITEIFIQRKIKGTRTPRQTESFKFPGVPASSRDFLSSPSLVQEYGDSRNYNRTYQTTQQQQIRVPGRSEGRYGGKRRLQEVDMDVRQMVQSQKHKRY